MGPVSHGLVSATPRSAFFPVAWVWASAWPRVEASPGRQSSGVRLRLTSRVDHRACPFASIDAARVSLQWAIQPLRSEGNVQSVDLSPLGRSTVTQRRIPDAEREREDDNRQHDHDGERIDTEEGVDLVAKPAHQIGIDSLGMVQDDGDQSIHDAQFPPAGAGASGA